jgi:hypothetical protein
MDDGFNSLNSSENLVKSPSNQNSLATPTIGHGKSNGMANNSTVMLTVGFSSRFWYLIDRFRVSSLTL